MSYLGIVLVSAFAANVLLAYGLGVCPAFRRDRESPLVSILALGLVNTLAAAALWILRVLVLEPLRLGSLDVLLFAVLVAPALKYLARAVASLESPLLRKIGSAADEAVVGCLVFGIALLSSRSGYLLPEAVLASASSCLGYWAALVILEAVRERLELSDLPASFRGAPSVLASAGLMAMAFMGIDLTLVKNLVG